MSWLFSRALVEEFSPASCSDGKPSAPLSVMPTQHKFWRNDKTMEPCDLSQFGLTCRPLTAGRGAELLGSYLAGFPAKTSAWPGAAKGSRVSDPGCGLTWRASLAKFDPSSSTWRTVQLSLLVDSELSSVTWPRSGMTADGQCWELPTLELRISAIASGWWPTPCATDNRNRKPPTNVHISATGLPKHIAPNGEKSQVRLSQAVRMWPTPLARDSRTVRGGARSMNSLGSEPLITQAAEAEGFEDGRLNPMWVEWLMGWPMGWTELRPLEMGKFREWPQQHSPLSLSNSTEDKAA